MMNDKAKKTIECYKMLKQGDRVIVGVSGGADSVALLVFLLSVRDEMSLELVACHLNHCLRGQESERDEKFVTELCTGLGVELVVKRVDIKTLATRTHKSVEETARAQRYKFFAEIAADSDRIATAHTANDNRETLLWNLTRGGGLRGLCAIPPVRGNIIRPFIACTRQDTEGYCRQNGLEWVEDSTNREMCYTRNILRHRVLPLLEELNPALSDNLTRQCAHLRRDADFLDELAADKMAELTGPGNILDRRGFLALPLPIADRILLKMVSSGGSPTGRMVELCRQKAEQGSGRQQLVGGWDFFATEAGIGVQLRQVRQAVPTVCEEFTLPQVGHKMKLMAGNREFAVSITNNNLHNYKNIYNSPLKNVINCDTISGNVKIRSCRMGDTLRLPGRGVSKTLKNLFQERGILPQKRRETLLLATEDDKILWVEGFGVAEDYIVLADTRKVMVIQPPEGE